MSVEANTNVVREQEAEPLCKCRHFRSSHAEAHEGSGHHGPTAGCTVSECDCWFYTPWSEMDDLYEKSLR